MKALDAWRVLWSSYKTPAAAAPHTASVTTNTAEKRRRIEPGSVVT